MPDPGAIMKGGSTMKKRRWMGSVLAAGMTCALLLSAGVSPAAAAGNSNYGFHVEADGTITVGGKPFYGVGVNFYDGFNRYAGARPSISSEDTIKNIAKAEIPFMRVAFSAYRAQGVQAYLESPRTYFKYMDQFVAWANENKVGIVASLFWSISSGWTPTVEGAVDKDIGNPDSALMKVMLQYTRDVVTRYKDNPAIWGWEIANEVNLSTDTGSSSKLSLKDVQSFYSAIAGEIRKYDSYRMISNGDATYRKEQYNLSNGKGWVQDTEEEFRQIVPQFAPGQVDAISCHPYSADYERYNRPFTIEEEMKTMVSIAKSNKKALFVGEFGVGDAASCDSPEAPAYFKRMLAAIKDSGVQLAAVWNMDMLGMDIDKGYYPEQSFAIAGPTSYKYTQTKEINAYYRSKSMQDSAAGWVAYDPNATPTTQTPPTTPGTTRRPDPVAPTASSTTAVPTAATESGIVDTEDTVAGTGDTMAASAAVTSTTDARQADTSDPESPGSPWLIILVVILGVLVLGGGVAAWYFLKNKRV